MQHGQVHPLLRVVRFQREVAAERGLGGLELAQFVVHGGLALEQPVDVGAHVDGLLIELQRAVVLAQLLVHQRQVRDGYLVLGVQPAGFLQLRARLLVRAGVREDHAARAAEPRRFGVLLEHRFDDFERLAVPAEFGERPALEGGEFDLVVGFEPRAVEAAQNVQRLGGLARLEQLVGLVENPRDLARIHERSPLPGRRAGGAYPAARPSATRASIRILSAGGASGCARRASGLPVGEPNLRRSIGVRAGRPRPAGARMSARWRP